MGGYLIYRLNQIPDLPAMLVSEWPEYSNDWVNRVKNAQIPEACWCEGVTDRWREREKK